MPVAMQPPADRERLRREAESGGIIVVSRSSQIDPGADMIGAVELFACGLGSAKICGQTGTFVFEKDDAGVERTATP
jgi:hypothetical protein